MRNHAVPATSPKLTASCSSHRATAGTDENGGRGSNGGVWEWSSTLLDTHEGFEGTTIFPGYSSDFFDTKHQVVVRILLFQLHTVC